MQLQPPPREEAWDEAAGPSIGERINCLDQFLHHNGDRTTAMWRPAVVVEHEREGDIVQEIKVHFEGFSAEYDKWISWPRERNRFASLGTSCSRTPSDVAEGSFDGLGTRSNGTDSRSSSFIAGGGSSSTGTTAPRRRRGFSRFKMFGAMKGLVRSRGKASTDRGAPTPPPPLGVSPSSSSTPAKAGHPQASPAVVWGDGRAPYEAEALAALCSEEDEDECKQEEKDDGPAGVEESKQYEELEEVDEDDGAAESFSLLPTPPSQTSAGEEAKEQQQQQQAATATTTGGSVGPSPPSLMFFPAAGAATAAAAADDDDSLPLLAATAAAGGSIDPAAGERQRTRPSERDRGRRRSRSRHSSGAAKQTWTLWDLSKPPVVGDRFDCLDHFVSKQDQNEKQKWRRAEVVAIRHGETGTEVLVHFLKWNAKWNRWISFTKQPERFATYGTRSGASTAVSRFRDSRGAHQRSAGGADGGTDATEMPAAAAAAAAAVPSANPSPLSSDVDLDLDLAPGVVEEEGKWEWRGLDSTSARGKGDGGDEVAAAAAAAAALMPIRELTPHLVEELEGEGGGFTLTVFQNNKQDKVPVPLVCGKYTTAYEAARAAEAFSSPVWHEPSPSSKCALCQSSFRGLHRRRHHCRNCGRLVCTPCALRPWPKSMLPHSYRTDSTEQRVRVCRTCYSTSSDFRRALLQGSYLGAMKAYNTGCVNLRAPCGQADEELPVHCAAAGGNVSLLTWLVEDRCCPIFVDNEKTVALLDAKGRSVMAAAAESGQVEAMRYLAFTQPSTVTDVGRETLWRGLQACLRYDEDDHNGGGRGQAIAPVTRGGRSCYKLGGASDDKDGTPAATSRNGGGGGGDTLWLSEGATSGVIGTGGDPLQAALDASATEAGYDVYKLPSGRSGGESGGGGGGGGGVRRKNVCIVCFSRKVNATLVPCGHRCCCMTCAEKFELCPICSGVRVTQRIKTIDG